MDGSTVQIEVDVIIFDPHIRNVSRIPGLDRRSAKRKQLLQILSVRRSGAIPENQSLTAHGERSARIHKLHLEVADDLVTRLLRHLGGIGRDGRRLSLETVTGCWSGGGGRRSHLLRLCQNQAHAKKGNRKEDTVKATHTPTPTLASIIAPRRRPSTRYAIQDARAQHGVAAKNSRETPFYCLCARGLRSRREG